MHSSSVIDGGCEQRRGCTKDNTICISCFSTKHTALRNKRKEWVARNDDKVSERNDMSTSWLLFQRVITQQRVLVEYKVGIDHHHHRLRGRHGRNHMVVGFTTTYAISAYYHWYCEFESRSGWGLQHYVIKFVID